MVSIGYRMCLQSRTSLLSPYGSRYLKPDPRNYLSPILVQHCSTKSSIFGSIFGRRKRRQEEEQKAKELEEEIVKAEENYEKEIEMERREEYIKRQQNKSRLNASDRRILKGQFPYIGVLMEESDKHREPKFKAEMLAKYGRETGINPSVAWPTKEQIEEDREYERVLYDNLTLRQMMTNVREAKIKELKEIEDKEREFQTKLVSMKKELKAWRMRIQSRNKQAEKEREKKEKILAELKQEYGYAINPHDPQFAEKIAAKEKEYAKRAKEEKKKTKAEQKTSKTAKQSEPDETAEIKSSAS